MTVSDKCKLEDMLQDGWEIVGTYGDTSIMLKKGDTRRLMDMSLKNTSSDELEAMLCDGWKIVSTCGYTSLVLGKGSNLRLIDKFGKHAIMEYEE